METEIKFVNKKPTEQEWKTWDSFEVGDVLEETFGFAKYAIFDGDRGKELFYISSLDPDRIARCAENMFPEMRKVGIIKKITFEIVRC